MSMTKFDFNRKTNEEDVTEKWFYGFYLPKIFKIFQT